MKKLFILFSFCTLLFMGACGDTSNTIIVGTNSGFRPFEYKEGGEVIGFDIDLIKEIGKKIGKEIKVNDMEFDSLIEAVSTGKIHVIASGMTITDERKEKVDFSVPYYLANQSVLIKNDSSIVIFSEADINNSSYKIGVQNDTTGAFWVDDNAPNATIKKYGKYVECIQDLENGNIDMIVLDKPTAEAYAQNRPVTVAYTIETNEQYGFAVKKGSDLLVKINAALTEIMVSDKWKELNDKYFGASN